VPATAEKRGKEEGDEARRRTGVIDRSRAILIEKYKHEGRSTMHQQDYLV
jgi:hypothetical protein